MMNLNYGDARNKNNSTGQNKLNKFTSNTYASSSINSISSFPTLTSSLNSNKKRGKERERERERKKREKRKEREEKERVTSVGKNKSPLSS
jgi:hypothetical protein